MTDEEKARLKRILEELRTKPPRVERIGYDTVIIPGETA